MHILNLINKIVILLVIVFSSFTLNFYPAVLLFILIYGHEAFNRWVDHLEKSNIDVEFKNEVKGELTRLQDITSKLSMNSFRK